MTDTYKRTGRRFKISHDDLLNKVYDKLSIYTNLSVHKRNGVQNPFEQPIIIKLSNGKLIEIPKNIQKIAIDNWMSSNAKYPQVNSQKNHSGPTCNDIGHTRLHNRDRYKQYSSSNSSIPIDPFIINNDINDYQQKIQNNEDYEINKLRSYEINKNKSFDNIRSNVKNLYGELPRDYEIFNRGGPSYMMYPDNVDNCADNAADNGVYNGVANYFDNYVDNNDTNNDCGINNINKKRKFINRGPKNQNNYMDNIIGIENIISPDTGCGTNVETYANVDSNVMQKGFLTNDIALKNYNKTNTLNFQNASEPCSRCNYPNYNDDDVFDNIHDNVDDNIDYNVDDNIDDNVDDIHNINNKNYDDNIICNDESDLDEHIDLYNSNKNDDKKEHMNNVDDNESGIFSGMFTSIFTSNCLLLLIIIILVIVIFLNYNKNNSK